MLPTTLVTAVGLAMDAVAVSISSGMSVKRVRLRDALKMAGAFGLFQAVMPLIGYLAGSRFRGEMAAWDHWLAFALLLGLGIKMIRDAREAGERVDSPFTWRHLTMLAIATSLDALAVGVSFSLLDVGLAETVLTIGLVTFALCLPAVWFGARLGKAAAQRADIAGGVILIAIGCKILVEHLLGGH